jgi:hypothetical protein
MSKKREDPEPDETLALFHNYKKELESIAESQKEIARSSKSIAFQLQEANNFNRVELLVLHREIAVSLRNIAFCICRLVLPSPATGFKIQQQAEGESMAITGVPVGGTGTFVAVTDPPGSALQAGNIPAWTVDDTLVSITPSADGFSVNASVGAADTAASFNLTISGVSSNGSAISTVTNVPILPGVAVPATGFVVNQTA